MKKIINLFFVSAIALILLSSIALACDIDDCNAIDDVGISTEESLIGNLFGTNNAYYSKAILRDGEAKLKVRSEDGSFSDNLILEVGETKEFLGQKITLLKIDTRFDTAIYGKGDLPECFKYCYPVSGDDYCGMNEKAYYSRDCNSEYCNDGLCENFDRRNCHEDCADEFCGDERCESFELDSCPDDCDEENKWGEFNQGGFFRQGEKYKIDDRYSIMFVNSNYKEVEHGDLNQIKGNFKIYDGNALIDTVELKRIDIATQPIKEVEYAFFYGGNNPEERAYLNIYKVKQLKDEIILRDHEGIFCDSAFIHMLKQIIPDARFGRSPIEFELWSLYELNRYPIVNLYEDVNKSNAMFHDRIEQFSCKGQVPYVKELNLEKEYVVLSFPPGTYDKDECTSDNECDDKEISTKDECAGIPKRCSNLKIDTCTSGDNYCPPDCTYSEDTDCVEPDQCNSNEDCEDNNACTNDECSGEPKKCTNQKISQGCNLNGECMPVGTKNENNYCDADNTFKEQQIIELECENNYECKSNRCKDNQCAEPTFINKVLNWIKNIFK